MKRRPARRGISTVAVDLSRSASLGRRSGAARDRVRPESSRRTASSISYSTGDRGKAAASSSRTSSRALRARDGGRDVRSGDREAPPRQVDQPYANHNGGQIAFGPDGFLYFGFGDGGSSGDPYGNGQNTNVLLGKILRIDPRAAASRTRYPPTNPFAGGGGRPEIYAYGLRNPWKFSFDKLTGELWLRRRRPEHDSRRSTGSSSAATTAGTCARASTASTATRATPTGSSIRSSSTDAPTASASPAATSIAARKIPALVGKFIYGDFGSRSTSGRSTRTRPGSRSARCSRSRACGSRTFAQDADGEVYVVDYATGKVKQLVAAPTSSAPPPSGAGTKLERDGLRRHHRPLEARPPAHDRVQREQPALVRRRAEGPLALRPRGQEDRRRYPTATSTFRPASVAVKTFSRRRKEDRDAPVRPLRRRRVGGLLVRVEGRPDRRRRSSRRARRRISPAEAPGISRRVASASPATRPAAGFTLGLEARQLNRPRTARISSNRFASVSQSRSRRSASRRSARRTATGASDEERARGVLHANCPSAIARAAAPARRRSICGSKRPSPRRRRATSIRRPEARPAGAKIARARGSGEVDARAAHARRSTRARECRRSRRGSSTSAASRPSRRGFAASRRARDGRASPR